MPAVSFKITHKEKHTNARTGILEVAGRKALTPAFVPVASSASIKSLTFDELKNLGLEMVFINTYHMLFRPGIPTVKKIGGLHKFAVCDLIIMTDSGGFQAFSLAGKYRDTFFDIRDLVKITDKGISFKSAWDGSQVFLNAKKSITAQVLLDSDIMMAFDECTFYPISEKRARLAMERTHIWAKESLKYKKNKALWGIVQGSVFENLRKESADFISRMNFDGFSIGSVANSKEPKEYKYQALDWSMPYLREKNKPVHFLGIGEIEDILVGVEKGIDSFDCVIPTRLARTGWAFSKSASLKNKFRFDITKKSYSLSGKPIDEKCSCLACQNYSIGYIHHLFKSRELLGYRLLTIHNLKFYSELFKSIRLSIKNNLFSRFKKEWTNC